MIGCRSGIYQLPFDPSTIAYMNALGIDANSTIYHGGTAQEITGVGIWMAVNEFVLGLKDNGIWSLIVAAYPTIGGTAARHAINLVDPRDSDAAFRLGYQTTWSHNQIGQLNNSNGWARTFINSNSHLSRLSKHLGVYTNNASINAGFCIGNASFTTGLDALAVRSAGNLGGYLSSSAGFTVANPDSRGFFLISRTNASQVSSYRNGADLGTNPKNSNADATQSNTEIEFGRAANNPSVNTYQYATVGLGLTPAQCVTYSQLVNQLQSRLGRSVY